MTTFTVVASFVVFVAAAVALSAARPHRHGSCARPGDTDCGACPAGPDPAADTGPGREEQP